MTVTPRTSTNCTRHSDTTPSHTVPAPPGFTTARCRSPTGSPASAIPRALPRRQTHSHHQRRDRPGDSYPPAEPQPTVALHGSTHHAAAAPPSFAHIYG